MQDRPEVRWQALGPHPGVDGRLSPKFFSRQEAVQSVEDAGKAHGFSPQRSGDWVNGTQFRN